MTRIIELLDILFIVFLLFDNDEFLQKIILQDTIICNDPFIIINKFNI